MKVFAALILSLVALQGCVTNDEFTGTGPVTLNDRQKSNFERWSGGSTDQDALYFFLVRGGGSYWVVCPETAAICRDATEYKWFQTCESKNGTGACRLYGVYGDVVWNFGAPADPNWSNGTPLYTASTANNRGASSDVDVRSVEIEWAGHSGKLTGTMQYRKSLRNYEINLLIPGETYCDGSAEFTRKTWTISCRNGVSANGTFQPLGQDKGSVGEGVDNRGRKIGFRVGPAGA